jgi:uncharacterized protein YecT (DUF1311 family)
MRLIVIATAILAVCGTSFAQRNVHVGGCYDSAQTQAELNRCASEGAKQADADLKVAYARLIKAASSDPTAQSKFRALENSWLRFRTAYLDASYPATDKQSSYGSMFPMEFDDLAAEITREQVSRVERLLKDYQDNK